MIELFAGKITTALPILEKKKGCNVRVNLDNFFLIFVNHDICNIYLVNKHIKHNRAFINIMMAKTQFFITGNPKCNDITSRG